DEQVGEALEHMRERHAEFRTVDRAAAPGDLVIVDYTLAPEGHDATSANGYQFLVGGGDVLPELDQAGVGMRAGQERNVPLRLAGLLQAIAGQEGIATTDEEIDAEVEKLAQAAQRPVPAVRRMMEKSGDLENLRGGLREKKTLDFLIEHAKVRA